MKMLMVAEGLLSVDATKGEMIAGVSATARAKGSGFIQTLPDLQNNLIDEGFLLLNAALVFRPEVVPAKDAKAWDSYLTTNPALFVHPNGEFWLYYKAWDRANDNMRKMGVAVSKKIEGPYERSPLNPLVSFAAQKKQVEDAYVWREGGTYYMLMRDMGVIHPHVGLLLTSADGLKWSAPELGYETSDHYFPGEKVQRFERPQILMQDGKARYVFLALMGGRTGTSSAAVLRIDD